MRSRSKLDSRRVSPKPREGPQRGRGPAGRGQAAGAGTGDPAGRGSGHIGAWRLARPQQAHLGGRPGSLLAALAA